MDTRFKNVIAYKMQISAVRIIWLRLCYHALWSITVWSRSAILFADGVYLRTSHPRIKHFWRRTRDDLPKLRQNGRVQSNSHKN